MLWHITSEEHSSPARRLPINECSPACLPAREGSPTACMPACQGGLAHCLLAREGSPAAWLPACQGGLAHCLRACSPGRARPLPVCLPAREGDRPLSVAKEGSPTACLPGFAHALPVRLASLALSLLASSSSVVGCPICIAFPATGCLVSLAPLYAYVYINNSRTPNGVCTVC